MKLDQIAYYAHDTNQVKWLKQMLGLADAKWIEDIVEGDVSVWGGATANSKAHLMFNYDLGIELEILTYLEGPHWHMTKPEFLSGSMFVSHIGFHMAPGEEALAAGPTIQRMRTRSHTNEYLLEKKRTYDYEIKASPLGVDFKFIWRIEGGVRV